MNIAKMLANDPIDTEELTPPLEEDSIYEFPEDSEETEDVISEGEEAAIAEIFDAFQAKDVRGLRTALRSFIELCRE